MKGYLLIDVRVNIAFFQVSTSLIEIKKLALILKMHIHTHERLENKRIKIVGTLERAAS